MSIPPTGATRPLGARCQVGADRGGGFFTPLGPAVNRLATPDGRLAEEFPVYAGGTGQRRHDCTVVPWSAVGTVPAW
jgi:hypothetical protein